MPTLLFDLDGTLIDSSIGITRCAAYAFEKLGEPVPDAATLRSWIGPPLRDSFAPLLRDANRVEAAVRYYRERYETHGWSEHTVYAGIADALAGLHGAGLRLAVVTAKNEPHARKILASQPFGQLFDDITGATLDGRLSHKPELIAESLQRLNAVPNDCIMIGDRSMDMQGAVHHGMRGVGVLWGFGTAEELVGAGAQRVLGSPAELLFLAP